MVAMPGRRVRGPTVACRRVMMNTRWLLQAGFACAIGTFLPAASCDGGDVNQWGCPDGETCSPETEDGLHFVGATIGEGFFDYGQVKTVARGGTETVRLEIDDGEARAPFALDYEAELGGPAHVESRTANVLVLRGDTGGPSYLRIVDPADGDALYDRVLIDSAPVARVGLSRTLVDLLTATPDDADLLYAPGSTAIVGLASADGRELVDDSMRLAGTGIMQVAWDQVQIGSLAPGMHSLTATTAGRTEQLAVRVVAGPDRIVREYGNTTVEHGSNIFVCYAAMLGDRNVHVAWSFRVDNGAIEQSEFEGCISVKATAAGTIGVHVATGGLSLDESIAVTPPTRARTVSSTVAADRGERAALSAGRSPF